METRRHGHIQGSAWAQLESPTEKKKRAIISKALKVSLSLLTGKWGSEAQGDKKKCLNPPEVSFFGPMAVVRTHNVYKQRQAGLKVQGWRSMARERKIEGP